MVLKETHTRRYGRDSARVRVRVDLLGWASIRRLIYQPVPTYNAHTGCSIVPNMAVILPLPPALVLSLALVILLPLVLVSLTTSQIAAILTRCKQRFDILLASNLLTADLPRKLAEPRSPISRSPHMLIRIFSSSAGSLRHQTSLAPCDSVYRIRFKYLLGLLYLLSCFPLCFDHFFD